MKITRRSPLTGENNTLDLDITEEQYREFTETPRHKRRFIQDIFPDLPAELREFILTGYTPEDWEALFPPDTGDDEDDTEEETQ